MKRFVFTTLISVIVIIGCERTIDSPEPSRIKPADAPVPTNLAVQVNDTAIYLTWDIVDPSSEVVKYYIYVTNNANGTFILHDSSNTTELTLDDLTINNFYYIKVASVLSDGLISDKSESISAFVSHLSMIIANNQDYTNNRTVTIRFTAPSTASHMIISEDPTFTGIPYETFVVQKSFTIDSPDDGLKTVYAKLQFNDGSSTKDLLSDDITLDTKVRIDSTFFADPDSVFVPGDTIVFGINTGEADGNASVTFDNKNITLNDNGEDYDDIAGDGIYHGWYHVPNNLDLYNTIVNGNFTDRASNRATAVASDNRLNINTLPQAVVLSAYKNAASDSVFINWTVSDASDFVNYRLYLDTLSSTVDQNDIVIYEAYSKNTTSFAYPLNAGTKWFRIFVFDQHGSFAGSNTVQIDN